MGCYWNQMGDEAYGTLHGALEQFASDVADTDVPAEYLGNLLLEMREVRERGYALKFAGAESPEVWKFWHRVGGRGLDLADFDLIDEFLTQRIS